MRQSEREQIKTQTINLYFPDKEPKEVQVR